METLYEDRRILFKVLSTFNFWSYRTARRNFWIKFKPEKVPPEKLTIFQVGIVLTRWKYTKIAYYEKPIKWSSKLRMSLIRIHLRVAISCDRFSRRIRTRYWQQMLIRLVLTTFHLNIITWLVLRKSRTLRTSDNNAFELASSRFIRTAAACSSTMTQ